MRFTDTQRQTHTHTGISILRDIPTHSLTQPPDGKAINAGRYTQISTHNMNTLIHTQGSRGLWLGIGSDPGTREQVNLSSLNFPWDISPSACLSPPHDWHKQ